MHLCSLSGFGTGLVLALEKAWRRRVFLSAPEQSHIPVKSLREDASENVNLEDHFILIPKKKKPQKTNETHAYLPHNMHFLNTPICINIRLYLHPNK